MRGSHGIVNDAPETGQFGKKRPRTSNTINLEDQATGGGFQFNSDYHLRQGICMQLISNWSRKTILRMTSRIFSSEGRFTEHWVGSGSNVVRKKIWTRSTINHEEKSSGGSLNGNHHLRQGTSMKLIWWNRKTIRRMTRRLNWRRCQRRMMLFQRRLPWKRGTQGRRYMLKQTPVRLACRTGFRGSALQ